MYLSTFSMPTFTFTYICIDIKAGKYIEKVYADMQSHSSSHTSMYIGNHELLRTFSRGDSGVAACAAYALAGLGTAAKAIPTRDSRARYVEPYAASMSC